MTKTMQRFWIIVLMFIPCLLVFSGCGNSPNNQNISYSVAFNRTGIPNFNAGTVKGYVLYNSGATSVTLSGLTTEQLDKYKTTLEGKNGFVLTSPEDGVDGKWARKNSIDGHDGDKIVLTATQNTNGLLDLEIYYESYFAMQEDPTQPTYTNLTNLVDSVSERGLYFSSVEDQTESVQTDDYVSQGINVESLSLKKDIVMAADGSWAYNYRYTIKMANDANFKYANLKIVYNHSLANDRQMTYLYSLEDPKTTVPLNDRAYAIGAKVQYSTVMQGHGDGIPNVDTIVSTITQGTTELLNKHIATGKIVYKNDVCDVEYYNFSTTDPSKQNLPFIFKNGRIFACKINNQLTDVSLSSTYNDSLLQADYTGFEERDAAFFVRYFFEKTFLAQFRTTE